MPKHLSPLWSQPINVQRKMPTGEWISMTVSMQEAFNIKDIDVFIVAATAAIKDVQNNKDKIKRNTLLEEVMVPCSFLKISDAQDGCKTNLYAVSKDVVGSGNFGRVKLALRVDDSSDSTIYTVKIQSPSRTDSNGVRIISNESKVATMIGFFINPILTRFFVGKSSQNKYYNISKYAGIQLKEWLKSNQPSDALRLDLALQICEKVYHLHDESKYTHGDIKLENVLINPLTHEVTLIDFGLASLTDTPNEHTLFQGSEYALPTFPRETNSLQLLKIRMRQIGVVGLDAFALKRLFKNPFVSVVSNLQSLFSEKMALETNRFIDSSSFTPPSGFISVKTPLELFAYLILYRYQQPIPSSLPPMMQDIIVVIHTNRNYTPDMKAVRLGEVLLGDASIIIAEGKSNLMTPVTWSPASDQQMFPSPLCSGVAGSPSGLTTQQTTPGTPMVAVASPARGEAPFQVPTSSGIRFADSFHSRSVVSGETTLMGGPLPKASLFR